MTTANQSHVSSRERAVRQSRLGALDWIMLGGLLGIVTAFTGAQALEGAIIPPVLIESIAYLICAGIVATGWRWSALVTLVIVSLGALSNLASGFPIYALSHPGEYIPFATEVLEYALTFMVVGACIVKLTQMRRREALHAPRWMTPALTMLAGVAIGALLVGATAKPSGSNGSVASASGTKSVSLTASQFAPDIVALHKGESLRIIDDVPVPHTLANGYWSADGRVVSGAEPGAPTIKDVSLNNNDVNVGPFTAPGVYHVYCTIHPGMTLTVVVR